MSIKFCPECGAKVENHHKFCPNCGHKIINTEQGGETRFEGNKLIICPVCGEENSSDNFECRSCGAALVKGKKPPKSSKTRTSEGNQRSSEKPKSTQTNTDQLDKTKIIYVAIGILAILLLVLYTSGIFDPVPTTVTDQNVPQDVSSGVNLNNMQRINDLENQVKNNPSDTKLLLELAHLKNDSGLPEQAIQDYKKYLQINPKDADVRIDMGVCYYNLKQYDQAIAEMKQALEYSPNHQIGHLNLGIVNLAAGNIEESRIWLSKAVEINPGTEIGKKAQELLQSH